MMVRSPVGFVVPSSNAYSGFTTTGVLATAVVDFKVTGAWNKGWNFIAENGQKIFFAETAWLGSNDGNYYNSTPTGYYWVAIPSAHKENSTGYSLQIRSNQIDPAARIFQKANAFAVRPMKEK